MKAASMEMQSGNKSILREVRSLTAQTENTKETLSKVLEVTQSVIDIKNDLLNTSNETANAVQNIANKVDGFKV